jgi:nucleotide-binding universal stress UspA family protein
MSATQWLRVQSKADRRVICATDLQPRSQAAMQRAVQLARPVNGRVMLVHAVDARQPWRAVRAACNRAYAQLLTQVDEMCGEADIPIDIAVRAGEPVDVISAVVSEQQDALLVTAAPQPRRFSAVVGTTAERLIRTTRRPLLAVHGTAGGEYRRVALATDLSSQSLRCCRLRLNSACSMLRSSP